LPLWAETFFGRAGVPGCRVRDSGAAGFVVSAAVQAAAAQVMRVPCSQLYAELLSFQQLSFYKPKPHEGFSGRPDFYFKNLPWVPSDGGRCCSFLNEKLKKFQHGAYLTRGGRDSNPRVWLHGPKHYLASIDAASQKRRGDKGASERDNHVPSILREDVMDLEKS